ncbi:MAG: hypothetical protein EBZ95_13350 [Chitinophagia bacterium]|nr:hypothetical protein [Chitinophagia bacterium]
MNRIKTTLTQLWKRTPFSFRSKMHSIKHRFNSNYFLLQLSSPIRHRKTCKKLRSLKGPADVLVGESYYLPGWVSTNYQVLCRNLLDVTKEFHNVQNLRYVVADNVIEHLTLLQGRMMLMNIYKSMESNGVIRIATPDLKGICDAYISRDALKLIDFSNDMRQFNLNIDDFPDLFRVTYCCFGHNKGYIYDFETLKLELERAGFTKVTKFLPGISEIENFKGIEKRKGLSDTWGQLCVEASKN